MSKEQLKEFNQLVDKQNELMAGWTKYWHQYSSFNDWHFWLMVILLILPLVVLYFFIDRRRMFQLGFFGYNVHVWQTYLDIASVNMGKWDYPHKLIPIFPISFSFDASFIPVTFMLVYQWSLNHKRNFYIFVMIPAFFFAFIAKPILVALDITKAGAGGGGWKAYLTLFISHIIVAYISKWITELFQKYYEKSKDKKNESVKHRRIIFPFSNWFRKKRTVR